MVCRKSWSPAEFCEEIIATFCSTKGNLNFNEELLQLEKGIGNYVIVHELLHFRYPNHGRVWKSLMTAYLGDYEKTEKKLKKIVSQQKNK